MGNGGLCLVCIIFDSNKGLLGIVGGFDGWFWLPFVGELIVGLARGLVGGEGTRGRFDGKNVGVRTTGRVWEDERRGRGGEGGGGGVGAGGDGEGNGYRGRGGGGDGTGGGGGEGNGDGGRGGEGWQCLSSLESWARYIHEKLNGLYTKLDLVVSRTSAGHGRGGGEGGGGGGGKGGG